jgi:hypothetical protein
MSKFIALMSMTKVSSHQYKRNFDHFDDLDKIAKISKFLYAEMQCTHPFLSISGVKT